MSDHELIKWSIATPARPVRTTVTYRFRNLKSIDLDQFRSDVMQSSLCTAPAESADKFAEQIDSVIATILDVHCPLQTRTKFFVEPR